MTALTARDIELYAINTAPLYPEHRRLAQSGASLDEWVRHVRNVVLPYYRKEIGYFVYSDKDVRSAALELKRYYQDHVKEDRRDQAP